MAREWVAVGGSVPEVDAKIEARHLRRLGFRAKAMFDLHTDTWMTCVSPPEDRRRAAVELVAFATR